MTTREKAIARRRLRRDLIELQQANILSIAAHPIDGNIFEWHVNIKPVDGVYSGVHFHLIMTFPPKYPSKPPDVKIKTPIEHPNIFDDWLCLSMLRPHTSNQAYEGWSGAYSATSVLMQLQSFLFAEKIDQDGGYQLNAQVSDHAVKHSIATCKNLQCHCGHTHTTPWPKVKGPPEALIKVFPTDPRSGHVQVQGSACQTTHTYWVGAYGEFGTCEGKVMYEAFINWTGDQWARNNIRGGLCRFGFGNESASVCGRDHHSFGYGGTGMYSYANEFNKFGQSFTKGDTITVAVDFVEGRIYFAKNGRLMEPERQIWIPDFLWNTRLYPILSFKNSRAEFNFGAPKRPCEWLISRGFRTLEDIAVEQGGHGGEEDDDGQWNSTSADWHSDGIIPELWLDIFMSLSVPEVFGAKFVCKAWHGIIGKYNLMERNEIYCYFSKGRLGSVTETKKLVLGIGLNITHAQSGYGVDIKTQMDILSENAWQNGCRIGVWGEPLTHFLPLAMNKTHCDIAYRAMDQYLYKIAKDINPNGWLSTSTSPTERMIGRSQELQLVDTLVTMMNQIVVQFVTGQCDKKPRHQNVVRMQLCEKVVLGYCALHHLLLFLKKRHKPVRQLANKAVEIFLKQGSDKGKVRDLGKFLIYLMISKYDWIDVAETFIKEVMTRNVRWMLKDVDGCYKYGSTGYIKGRAKDTFAATSVSRRLVMFQVWFMKMNARETLKGYNERLGRPRVQMRNGVVPKTKYILRSTSWWDYFNELEVTLKDDKAIDQLLRFAVYNSARLGYHRGMGGVGQKGSEVRAPKIRTNGVRVEREGVDDDEEYDDMPMAGVFGSKPKAAGIKLSGGSTRGWGRPKQMGSGWTNRGRGRGRGGAPPQRGRGRGNVQSSQAVPMRGRGGRGRAMGRGARGRGGARPYHPSPGQQPSNQLQGRQALPARRGPVNGRHPQQPPTQQIQRPQQRSQSNGRNPQPMGRPRQHNQQPQRQSQSNGRGASNRGRMQQNVNAASAQRQIRQQPSVPANNAPGPQEGGGPSQIALEGRESLFDAAPQPQRQQEPARKESKAARRRRRKREKAQQ